MLSTAVSFLPVIFWVVNAQVDDTPFDNMTVDWTALKGPCIRITAEKVLPHKKYEGRWYGVYLGFTEDTVKSLRCLAWDFYFDDSGNFHNFFHVQENGTQRTLIDKGIPLSPREGIYSLDIGNKDPNEHYTATLFYVDNELFYWWEILCDLDKGTVHRNVALGYRNVADVPRKQHLVDRLTLKLKLKGGVSERHRIDHDNCVYPPKAKNPYE